MMIPKFNKINLNAKKYYDLLATMYNSQYSEYYPEQKDVLKSLGDIIKVGKYNCAIDYNLMEQAIIIYIRGVKYKLNPIDIIAYDGIIPKYTSDVWTNKVEELIYTLLLMVDVYRGYKDNYTVIKGLTMFRYFTDVFPKFCTNFESGFFLNEGFSEDCLVDLINWCNAKRLLLYSTTIYSKSEFIDLYEEYRFLPKDKLGVRSEKELIRDVLELILDEYSDINYFNNPEVLYSDIKLRETGNNLREFLQNNNVLQRQ